MRPLFFAVTLAVAFSSAGLQAREAVSWAPSYDAGQRMASAQGKLLLLHFCSNNCPPCKGVDNNVFSQPRVGDALAEKFVCVKINVDKDPALAKQYKVTQWPTDVIVTPAGHLIAGPMVSSQSPDGYLAQMSKAFAMARNAMPVQTQVAANGPAAAQGNTAPANANLPQISYGQPSRRAEAQPIGYNDPSGAPAPGGYDPYRGGAAPAGPSGNFTPPPSGGNLAPGGNPGGYSGQYDTLPPADPALAGQLPQFGPGAGGAVPPGPAGYVAPNGANAPNVPVIPPTQPQYAPTLPATSNWAPAERAWNDAQQPGGAPMQQFAPHPTPGASGAVPGGALPAGGLPPFGPMQPGPMGPVAPAAAPVAPAAPQVMINPHQPAANVAAANTSTAQPPAAPPAARPAEAAPTIPAGNPPLGIEGYCPVSLVKEKKWLRGDVRYGAIHRGRTYLFSSKERQEEFLKNPDTFCPMLSGFDPVKYADQGILIPGNRRFGVFYGKQIYLFADEDAVNRFNASPLHYAPIVRQAMTQGGSDTVQR